MKTLFKLNIIAVIISITFCKTQSTGHLKTKSQKTNINIDLEKIKADRIMFDGIGNIYPATKSVNVIAEKIRGIECYWFNPENPKSNELIIYFHGGGYAIGSIQSHKAMVRPRWSSFSAIFHLISFVILIIALPYTNH